MALESSGMTQYVAKISINRIIGLEIVRGAKILHTYTHTHTHTHTPKPILSYFSAKIQKQD